MKNYQPHTSAELSSTDRPTGITLTVTPQDLPRLYGAIHGAAQAMVKKALTGSIEDVQILDGKEVTEVLHDAAAEYSDGYSPVYRMCDDSILVAGCAAMELMSIPPHNHPDDWLGTFEVANCMHGPMEFAEFQLRKYHSEFDKLFVIAYEEGSVTAARWRQILREELKASARAFYRNAHMGSAR